MDDELKAMLVKVLDKVEGLTKSVARLEGGLTELKAGQVRLEGDVKELKADVTELKAGQARILEHLDVAELKGRVEEQSRTIASLIPTRVAAVPGRTSVS